MGGLVEALPKISNLGIFSTSCGGLPITYETAYRALDSSGARTLPSGWPCFSLTSARLYPSKKCRRKVSRWSASDSAFQFYLDRYVRKRLPRNRVPRFPWSVFRPPRQTIERTGTHRNAADRAPGGMPYWTIQERAELLELSKIPHFCWMYKNKSWTRSSASAASFRIRTATLRASRA